MKPLFLAGHLALDFINTTMSPGGTPIELIGDGAAFASWLVDAGVLDAAAAAHLKRRLGAAELDELAAEARRLRGWAAAWIARWHAAPTEPGAPDEPELRRLNEWLEGATVLRQVVRQPDGTLAIVERRRGDAPGELLGALAAALADLVVHHARELVKPCDSAACTLWFLDRTRGHRRRFCSVAACGNREKVAAFRARQRSSAKPAPRSGRPRPGAKR
jgi:predicted RNA-binding Zn ribbon-like protein